MGLEAIEYFEGLSTISGYSETLHEKNDFAEGFKILLDTNQKNNLVELSK